jgi:TatD DNase family protein
VSASYVDAHCHVDAYDDPPGILAAGAQAGVVIVAVTELPSTYKRLRVRLGNRPLSRLAIGLHPLRAHHVTPSERHLFLRELTTTDYVGEVGLDFSRDYPPRRTQLDLFEWALAQPLDHKVVSLHSRGAEKELIGLLASRHLRGPVLHWYSGQRPHVDDALGAGCYFSVNLPMTRSKKGRALLDVLPQERVLTETDGPYAKNGRRESRPTDIPAVIESLARLWGLSTVDAQQVVWDNMVRLYTSVVDAAPGQEPLE